jgi:hypothetical protein
LTLVCVNPNDFLRIKTIAKGRWVKAAIVRSDLFGCSDQPRQFSDKFAVLQCERRIANQTEFWALVRQDFSKLNICGAGGAALS